MLTLFAGHNIKQTLARATVFQHKFCTCQQKLDTKIIKLDVEEYLAYSSNESLYKRSATP